MGNSKLKYGNKVYSKITRIYDPEIGKYHLLRNDTKIFFGNSERMIGSVFMSNPGSFEFKYDDKWEIFKNGGGTYDAFESDLGTPDSTMINIIKSIEEAYLIKDKKVPDGYIRIYNLSSVRCPKGKEALEIHKRIKQLLIESSEDTSLLEDPSVYDKTCFNNICNHSTFVIMGYLKMFLPSESKRLIKWIDECNKDKKVTAYFGTNDYPYHPMQWLRLNHGKPFEEIVNELAKLI